MTIFFNPNQIFTDNETGAPLSLGTVYFGLPNQDPETNPKQPFSDAACTVAVSAVQTLTAAGKLSTRLFLSGDYSLTVKSAGGSTIFSYASVSNSATSIGYGESTVAAALDDVMAVSGVRQGLVAGTNIDAEFAQWCADYEDSGVVLRLRPGVYTITDHYRIQGWTLDLSGGAEINCNGSDDTQFGSGFIEVVENGRIFGGVVYTSGAMTGTYADSHTARSCVLLCNGGEIDGTEVYSQINTGIKHYEGSLKKPIVYGGVWQGVECYWTEDITQDPDAITYNTGVRYVSKVAQSSGNISNVFAMLVYFTIDITRQVIIRHSGQYSTKQGLWIESSSYGVVEMSALTIEGPVFDFAGRYLASGTTLTDGDPSGTGLEVISCPDVVIIDPKTLSPRGYNLAIAYCPDAVVQGGASNGSGDDPCVVVVNSDRATIYDHLADGGTIGFSIGEDGANSDDVKLIGCAAKNCSYGPVQFSIAANGDSLLIDRMTVIGDVIYDAGDFSGPGELYDFCRVIAYNGATQCNVSLTNSTIIGNFTEIFRAKSSAVTISVHENNNTYACPFVPPPVGEIFRGRGLFNSRSAAIPMITGSSGGRANVGTFTINNATVNSSYVLNVTNIVPYVGTKASASFDAGDMYLVWYVKRAADMTGQLRIGLDDAASSDAGRIAVTCYLDSIFSNAASLLTNTLANGEWFPMAVPLRDAVYSGVADFAALTRLQVVKFGYSVNYTLEMTNPVIVMRKSFS